MGDRFNGEMLTLARQLRKVSQAELVAALKDRITQGQLSKIERGRIQPDADLAAAIAGALQLRPSFFSNGSYVRVPSVSFHRKRQKLGARDLDAIHAQAEVYRLTLKRLLEGVELEPTLAAVPAMDPDAFDGRVSEIAAAIRQHWMVPRGPIKSVTKLIEDSGVIIVPFEFGTPLIDGFGQHAADGLPPIIFINSTQPVDRLRFSLAHELGHLVMHQTPNPDQEVQANRFASEFLMPTREIKPQLYGLGIQRLMDLKLYWGVSMQSLIYKAWEAGSISDRSKKYHFVQMSKRGFREREPVQVTAPEAPSTLRDVISAHLNELGYTPADLGEMFGLSEADTLRLYPVPRQKPQLRIIV